MKNSKKYFDNVVLTIHAIALLVSVFILIIKGFSSLKFVMLFLIGSQIFAFVSFTLPLLVLYVNYKKFSINIIFELDLKKSKMYLKNLKKHIFIEIPFENVKIIYKVYSYNKSFVHFGYMDLFYFEIIDNDNKSYIVTCLLEENLDKYIHKDKIVNISRFFPYINYSVHDFD